MDVGLDYLRLGQPATTLSGGEAQRLKLASFLASTPAAMTPRPGVRRPSSCSTSRPPGCTRLTSPSSWRRSTRLLDLGHSLILVEHAPGRPAVRRLDHRPGPGGGRGWGSTGRGGHAGSRQSRRRLTREGPSMSSFTFEHDHPGREPSADRAGRPAQARAGRATCAGLELAMKEDAGQGASPRQGPSSVAEAGSGTTLPGVTTVPPPPPPRRAAGR